MSVRDTGPDPEARRLVAARSGGVCERCRRALAVDVHHRRARGMGGTGAAGINSLSNLVHLCRACHGWVEADLGAASASGWKIPLGEDPAVASTVPVVDVNGQETILTDAGTRWVHVTSDDRLPTWF